MGSQGGRVASEQGVGSSLIHLRRQQEVRRLLGPWGVSLVSVPWEQIKDESFAGSGLKLSPLILLELGRFFFFFLKVRSHHSGYTLILLRECEVTSA